VDAGSPGWGVVVLVGEVVGTVVGLVVTGEVVGGDAVGGDAVGGVVVDGWGPAVVVVVAVVGVVVCKVTVS
jgi:hypothetical protein